MTHNQRAVIDAETLDAIAHRVGTPCYVYDQQRLLSNYQRLREAFDRAARALGYARPIAFNYAVKANANPALLQTLRAAGAGFDVVSGGELRAALRAGAAAGNIVFAGVGKTDAELIEALEQRIGWVNVESAQELDVLSTLAVERGLCQRVALRINPGVDPHTHAYLATGKTGSKFGIEIDEALGLVRNRADFGGVSIEGLHVHNGSMISEAGVFAESAGVMIDVLSRCRALGLAITDLDMGGGFGVAYQPGQPEPDLDAIAREVVSLAARAGVNLQFEPGRFIVADAGLLVTRVLYTKMSGGLTYAVVDAAMNDLIRPALYQAKHAVSHVHARGCAHPRPVEIVGPVCESGDFLAHAVPLCQPGRGDLLKIEHAGAYGMSMASNYNLRPRAAEVLVDGASWRVVRAREQM
jgi:diaminopimelate decarboxylase